MGNWVAPMFIVVAAGAPGGFLGAEEALRVASQANALAQAQARAAAFDLPGAVTLLAEAGERGDSTAQIAAVYVRGLLDAGEAARHGGTADSLVPVRRAIDWLDAVSMGRPGPAEIARLTLQAAAAAAQSERDEMRLYLDAAVRMESIQVAAGLPAAPLIPAAEAAGDLWRRVHRYEEARQAYSEAAERFGSSPRILAGQGQSARGAGDQQAACAAFTALVGAWGGGEGAPLEIEDARAYVRDSCSGMGDRVG